MWLQPPQFYSSRFFAAGALLGLGLGSLFAAGQDVRVPQTVLSLCTSLNVVSRETVTPGTGIGISPDGRWLVQYVHTPRGMEMKLLDRDSGQERRMRLDPPPLPPGVIWKATGVAFSPAGNAFVLRSVGALWMVDAGRAQVRFQIGLEKEKQLYPGQASLAAGQLAVAFWPAESYLADAAAKKPIEVRFYDAASGRHTRTIELALDSSSYWMQMALAPDAARLAVLLRPTRWPGKAHLALYQATDGKLLWQRKVSAEDLAWSADGHELLILGGQLAWLDAATGKELRATPREVRFSESQTLRASEPANLAVGSMARFNPLKRGLLAPDRRDARLLLWRLDNGKVVCEQQLRATQGVDVWPTARGELIALEEQYDVRPPLRLLQRATLVVYRLESTGAEKTK